MLGEDSYQSQPQDLRKVVILHFARVNFGCSTESCKWLYASTKARCAVMLELTEDDCQLVTSFQYRRLPHSERDMQQAVASSARADCCLHR